MTVTVPVYYWIAQGYKYNDLNTLFIHVAIEN